MEVMGLKEQAITREGAAAKGLAELHGEGWVFGPPINDGITREGSAPEVWERKAAAALAAADAHDEAEGVHRITLDQLTRAMYDVDPLKFIGDPEPVPWEKLGPAWRELAKDKARAVLAALEVKA